MATSKYEFQSIMIFTLGAVIGFCGEETIVLHLAILIDGPELWSRPGSEGGGVPRWVGVCFSASGSGITNAKQGGGTRIWLPRWCSKGVVCCYVDEERAKSEIVPLIKSFFLLSTGVDGEGVKFSNEGKRNLEGERRSAVIVGK